MLNNIVDILNKNKMYSDDTYEDEDTMLPSGYQRAMDKLRVLVSLLNASKNMNDVQFLLCLSSDVNLFRLYMQYTEIDQVYDAVRYLFIAYPTATKSKKIKVNFCQNMSEMKSLL